MKKLFKLPEEFEKQYEAEFISKPTDIIWLDKEAISHRRPFTKTDVMCIVCLKEIKILYLTSMSKLLPERLNGKICPNCNRGSLRIY